MTPYDEYILDQLSGLNDPVEADAEIRSRNFNRRQKLRCFCWDDMPRAPHCDDCLIREDEE